MSFNIFNFLRLFFCVYLVTSAAHAQSSVWNDHKLKTEYFEEKIDELTDKNTKLVDELKRLRNRENELSNEIDSIGKLLVDAKGKIETLEKSKQEVDTCCAKQGELMRDMKLMKVEIKELMVEIMNCQERDKDAQYKIDLLDKELREVKRRFKRLQMGVTEPYNYHLWNEYYNEEPNFSWVIDDWKSQMNQKPSWMLSPVFPLKGYPFGAQANLTVDEDDYLIVSLAFKDLNNNSSELDLKTVPAVYYTFKCRKTNQHRVQIIRVSKYQFSTKIIYDTFYFQKRLIKSSDVSNDMITIEVHVEPPSLAERGVSHDGTLTWAIDDFQKKRTMEKKNPVWYQNSPYFYSNPKGYKVQADIHLNGFNDFKWIGLSFGIYFLTGPYDATLTKSFKYRTTVTLLHPTDPNRHITKSVDGDLNTKPWEEIDMATNEEVDKLLHEDTLYIKIEIVAI